MTKTGMRAYGDNQFFFDSILIQNLTFDMCIGINAFEKETPQPICVSVRCQYLTKRKSHFSDSSTPKKYICYKELTDRIIEHAQKRHILLVEDLAEDISSIALSFSMTHQVIVQVLKPTAIPMAAAVGVEIMRRQSIFKKLKSYIQCFFYN